MVLSSLLNVQSLVLFYTYLDGSTILSSSNTTFEVITLASHQTMTMVHLQPDVLKCVFQASYLLCFFSAACFCLLLFFLKCHFLKNSDHRIRLDIHVIFPNFRGRGRITFLHLYQINVLVSPQAVSPQGVRSKLLGANG